MKLFLLLVLTFFCTNIVAEETVQIDHLNLPDGGYATKVKLNHGEEITITITNTEVEHFMYEIVNVDFHSEEVENANKVKIDGTSLMRVENPTKKWTFETFMHHKRFQGYLVKATLKPGYMTNVKDLKTKTWYIPVNTLGWSSEFHGGFVISRLVDPVFFVGDKTGANSANNSPPQVIYRNEDAENWANLNAAGFIHVFKDNHPNWAYTFGLGINENASTNYLLGLTYRLGEKAAVTVGYHLGKIKRKPSEVVLGETEVQDANVLNDLPSKNDGNAFFSISYRFIKIGDLFQKPFSITDQEKE